MRLGFCVFVALVGVSCSSDAEREPHDFGAIDGSITTGAADAASAGAADAASATPDASPTGGTSTSDASSGVPGGGAEGGTSSPPDAGETDSASAPPVDCPPVASGNDTGPARPVTVDAQNIVGTIRSLQGAHWDPGAGKQPLSLSYADIGVDTIRTHDAAGINGSGAGDIDGPGRSRIFPNLNADPNLETSYNFGPTDALIKNIRDAGAEVYFRVGRSNISGGNKVPPDFDKYAEIVKHVVMHYNQGWANGFTHGIRYFEIWNEPDFTPFWLGTGEQYHELYKKIVVAIRAVDPNAIVGGPANSTFNDKMKTRASFLQYLRDNKLPLDFYSFHKYTNKSQDPMDYARMARSFREELDKFGFTKAQIMNTEWETSLQGDVMLGGEAGRAAFTAAALMYMQDGPVDKAHSYMRIGSTASKPNLALKAISQLKATPARLCAQGGDDNGFPVLAGRSMSAPELRVVIANYQIATSLMGPIPGGNEEAIEVPGLGHLADMTYLDRRTFTYPDKNGYALTIRSIPESWGHVTVKQYRIDASNSLTLVGTTMSNAADRPQGSLTVSGTWARARASPSNDPKGAPQGVDLIVVSGSTSVPQPTQ